METKKRSKAARHVWYIVMRLTANNPRGKRHSIQIEGGEE
jgi:hypothetical protein